MRLAETISDSVSIRLVRCGLSTFRVALPVELIRHTDCVQTVRPFLALHALPVIRHLSVRL